jgi:hypothetical protein
MLIKDCNQNRAGLNINIGELLTRGKQRQRRIGDRHAANTRYFLATTTEITDDT